MYTTELRGIEQRAETALRTLVNDAWIPAIRAAEDAAKDWLAVADDCMYFFTGACGFQYNQAYRQRAFGSPTIDPLFKLTLQKGFDVVALFGPALFARTPGRRVRPFERSLLASSAMEGDFTPPSDPWLSQVVAAAAAERESQNDANRFRALLYQTVLDYSAREFPGGGLQVQGVRGVTDFLTQGRGVLWCETAELPSGGRLVGSVRDSPRDLLIDAEATSLEDANWIARRHRDPVWKVARRFGIPEKELGKAKRESPKARRSRSHSLSSSNGQGEPGDVITWYEVFSKCGCGRRVMGSPNEHVAAMDQIAGDYAYLCVADGMPYPLNVPPKDLMREESQEGDEALKRRLQWPVPYWLDDLWPCEAFDAYEDPDNPYPIAILQPYMGLLKLVNVLLCLLAQKAWTGAKDLYFTEQSLAEKVEEAIASAAESNRAYEVIGIPVMDSAAEDINKAIAKFGTSPITSDIWQLVTMILQEFNKGTGLQDLLYGGTSSQSRSAADAATKRDALSTRPEHLASRVEDAMAGMARREKLAARWSLTGGDFGALFGNAERLLWENLVERSPVELAIRDLDVTIDPGSSRRVHRQRKQEGIATALPNLLAEFSKHADATGDTQPMNSLVRDWLASLDVESQDYVMGERMPPSPAEVPGVGAGVAPQ